MLDLWAKQTQFAVYLQQQTLRRMMAPMAFFGAMSGTTLPVSDAAPAEPAAAPEPAAEPVVETAEAPVAEPKIKAVPDAPVAVETKPVETKSVETKPGETKSVETKPVETKPVEAKPVETKAKTTKPEPEPVKSVAPGQPVLLDAPRGEADDLTALKGVGPKLASALNESGIWHLDQLADLTEAQAKWIDDTVAGVRGKATRDNWAEQAKTLMKS